MYNNMSAHIYIPTLHIFLYVDLFAHMKIHYVKVVILITLAVAFKGKYRHVHANIPSSTCAGDIQLKN